MPPLQNGSPTVATKHAERAHTNTLTREKNTRRPRVPVHARAPTPARRRLRWTSFGGVLSTSSVQIILYTHTNSCDRSTKLQTREAPLRRRRRKRAHSSTATTHVDDARPRRRLDGRRRTRNVRSFVCFPADHRGGFLARIKEERRQRIGTRLQRPLAAAAAGGRRTNGDDETHGKKRRR